MRKPLALVVASAFVFVACTDPDASPSDGAAADESVTASTETSTPASTEPTSTPASTENGATPVSSDIAEPRPRYRYPDAPTAPSVDAANADADAAIDRILDAIGRGFFDAGGATLLGESGDARHAWFVSDLLRFVSVSDAVQLLGVFEELTGVDAAQDPDAIVSPWLAVTNHLIAWDTPAYDGYTEDKASIFLLLEERWEPFFADEDSTIDWRLVSWGGVFIDDRPLGDTAPCPQPGCIPALDDFATTDAAGGNWYPDDRIVFGLELGGETLAIPLNLAEVHEMFNFELGGRRVAMPYCTLCGSAQAYLTDRDDGSPTLGAEQVPVLRTSGLLSRSNKVMYDLVTSSVFDTFTGDAVSGPLREAEVTLEEITVVRSTWGEWKSAHPDTRIVAEDGGIGRSYQLDPLGGRDDDGPIFPIGSVDERLDVHELVVGVLVGDGEAVAFPSAAASATIDAGGDVELAGIRLEAAGDGLRAVDATTGDEVSTHEAFWFAWSQFHPATELWLPS